MYAVIDCYEGEAEIVGRAETVEQAKQIERNWTEETDGECWTEIVRYKEKPLSGGIAFNYYSEIFKKFRYIVFYVVDDTLIMELTNETKENAYTLTQRGTSIRTHISGMAGEQMNRFCGEYRDVKFYNKTKSNPLLYITL